MMSFGQFVLESMGNGMMQEDHTIVGYHGSHEDGGQAIGAERHSNKFKWLAQHPHVATYFANHGVRTPSGVLLPGAKLNKETHHVKNPLIVDMHSDEWKPKTKDGKSWSQAAYDTGKTIHEIGHVKEKAAKMALANGHDSIIFKNGYDCRPYEGDIYAVSHSSPYTIE